MVKLISLLKRLDDFIDRRLGNFWSSYKNFLPLFGIVLIGLMIFVTVWRSMNYKPAFISSTLRNDIAHIGSLLTKIDTQCTITRFAHQQNYVDFLTVEKFSGPEVGCLSLAHPEKWQGPYVKENHSMREKVYEIVRGKDGFYVVPGKGVELPNGLIMGYDIVITPDVSVQSLLRQGGPLNYHGDKLAQEVEFATGTWQDRVSLTQKFKDKTDLIEEFVDALP